MQPAPGTLESSFKDLETDRDSCCYDEHIIVLQKQIEDIKKMKAEARAIVGITANPDFFSGATIDELKAANPWDKPKSKEVAKKLCLYGLNGTAMMGAERMERYRKRHAAKLARKAARRGGHRPMTMEAWNALIQTRCLICYPLHRRLGVGVTLGFHIELALKGGKLAAGTLDRLVLPCSTLRSVSSARSTADCNAAQRGVVI